MNVKSSYNNLTHTQLCEIGTKYLARVFRCGVAICEPSSLSPEKPDCLGFYHTTSILLEAKISRSDFMKDKTKPFRNGSVKGIGTLRYYIAPKGLLSIDDIPPMWGLLEVDHKGKVAYVLGQHPTKVFKDEWEFKGCLLYTSPSPRD